MESRPHLRDASAGTAAVCEPGGEDLVELLRELESRRGTSVAAVERCLERIARTNRAGPCLNAVLEVDPDALAVAAERDDERRRGRVRGPLHGVPVLLKDNLSTADGTGTTGGSWALQGLRFRRDAAAAARLRRAGAVLLGKANMVEHASGTGLPSARGGPVRNPYALDRGADGSSNGLCAAVAAGYAPAGVGTDSRCSLRFPAADCGLAAVKPTFGLVGRSGVLPGDPIVDVVGPVARSVAGVALLLETLAGPDSDDPAARPAAPRPGWARAELGRRDLAGLRLGVLRQGCFGVDPEVDRVAEAAIRRLAALGAEIVDGLAVEPIPYGGGDPGLLRLFAAATARDLARFLRTLAADSAITRFDELRFVALAGLYPTSKDLSRDLRALTEAELRGAETLPETAIAAARERFFALQRRPVSALLAEHRLDALVFPTKSRRAARLLPEADPARRRGHGLPEVASYSGLPEVVVPAGRSADGVPVGLSFLAGELSEPRLIGIAAAFERAAPAPPAPELPPVPPPVRRAPPPVPANDRFARRLRLDGPRGRVEGNSFSASIERGEPRHGSTERVDRSVWYAWTAPAAGRVRWSLRESPGGRFVLAVYRGSGIGELREIACSDHPGSPPPERGVVEEIERVSFRAEAGGEYAVAVAAAPRRVGSGDFVLTWEMETGG